MVKKLVTRSKFARMTGVSAAAITKACGKDNLLKQASVGKRLDIDHPSAISYRRAHPVGAGSTIVSTPPTENSPHKRGYRVKNEKKKKAARDRLVDSDPAVMIHEVPEDIQAFADMTLRELIQRFGTDTAFVDWLKATQSIEAINEKRLKNAQTKGELVSRELVKIGIIEPIDAAHIRLLTDGAKTIARRVTAMQGAGKPLEEIEAFVVDQLTAFIRPVKAKVARALKTL